MRRTVLLLVSVALAVLLTAGVAWAATIDCVTGEYFCVGTDEPDTTNGSEEKDKIYGQDGEKDDLACGAGDDTIFFDEGIDVVNPAKCETLKPPQE
jgi:hypothetical protein